MLQIETMGPVTTSLFRILACAVLASASLRLDFSVSPGPAPRSLGAGMGYARGVARRGAFTVEATHVLNTEYMNISGSVGSPKQGIELFPDTIRDLTYVPMVDSSGCDADEDCKRGGHCKEIPI